MEKFFILLSIIVISLALPYIYKIYGLKKITEQNLPDSGSWIELSRGNIYFEWFLPKETRKSRALLC